jgi:O-antigen/teichoic acid export membrane protein
MAQSAGQHRVFKNTLYLGVAQALTIPLSIASNALMGRYLGPLEFGYLYVASTLCGFGALAFEWGHQGALPALVARDRTRSGVYLGTSLAWRSVGAVLVAGVLGLVSWLLGHEVGVLWALALMFPTTLVISLGSGMNDAIRGFERADIPAFAYVTQQLVNLLAVAPVLLFGGHLRSVLVAQFCVVVSTALYLRHWLARVGVGKLKFERTAVTELFGRGTPFVFFNLAMVLLPNINVAFLSKYVPVEVIGWYSVSQRLVGLIIFPASALIGALYPTLCRLQAEDPEEFVRVCQSSLYGVSLLAIPAALGCALFPELGVMIYGSEQFSGAESDLRVLSLFVFLVYFSMPLGTCVLAANRQRVWAIVQCSCVVVSLILCPFLVPFFQRRMGNGAVGTCVTLVISEAFVVVCGLALAPRGLFSRDLAKSLLLAGVAGAAMAGVAVLTKPISIFLAVPAALLAYGVVAWFSGAVRPSTIEMAKGFLNRKLKRE